MQRYTAAHYAENAQDLICVKMAILLSCQGLKNEEVERVERHMSAANNAYLMRGSNELTQMDESLRPSGIDNPRSLINPSI